MDFVGSDLFRHSSSPASEERLEVKPGGLLLAVLAIQPEFNIFQELKQV